MHQTKLAVGPEREQYGASLRQDIAHGCSIHHAWLLKQTVHSCTSTVRMTANSIPAPVMCQSDGKA